MYSTRSADVGRSDLAGVGVTADWLATDIHTVTIGADTTLFEPTGYAIGPILQQHGEQQFVTFLRLRVAERPPPPPHHHTLPAPNRLA